MTQFLNSFDEDENFDDVTDFWVQENFLLLDSDLLSDQVGQDSSFLEPKFLPEKESQIFQDGFKNPQKGFSFSKNEGFFLKKIPLMDFQNGAINALQEGFQFQASEALFSANQTFQASETPFCFFNLNNHIFDSQNMVFLFIDSEFEGDKSLSLQWLVVFIEKTNLSCFLFLCSMWNLSLLEKFIFPKLILRKVMKWKPILQFLMKNKMCLCIFWEKHLKALILSKKNVTFVQVQFYFYFSWKDLRAAFGFENLREFIIPRKKSKKGNIYQQRGVLGCFSFQKSFYENTVVKYKFHFRNTFENNFMENSKKYETRFLWKTFWFFLFFSAAGSFLTFFLLFRMFFLHFETQKKRKKKIKKNGT